MASVIENQMEDNEAKVLCEQFVEKLRIPTFDEDATEVLTKLSLVVENILKQPFNEKYRSIPLQNKNILNLIDKYPAALEYLEILGFKRTKEAYKLEIGKEDPKLLTTGLQVLTENIDLLTGRDIGKEDEFKFDFSQPHVIRLGSQVLPTNENLLREKKIEQIAKQREDQIIQAGIPDRELKVYQQESAREVKLPELAENYLRRADLEILRAVSSNINNRQAQGFQTKAMRDLEAIAKSTLYVKTCICVQFPDNLVIQANFSPLERIADVQDQIMKCLQNPEKDKFYLFERPKNVRLSPEATLRDLTLVPRARLFVGWEGQAPEGEYIREELLSGSDEAKDTSKPTKERKRKSLFPFF